MENTKRNTLMKALCFVLTVCMVFTIPMIGENSDEVHAASHNWNSATVPTLSEQSETITVTAGAAGTLTVPTTVTTLTINGSNDPDAPVVVDGNIEVARRPAAYPLTINLKNITFKAQDAKHGIDIPTNINNQTSVTLNIDGEVTFTGGTGNYDGIYNGHVNIQKAQSAESATLNASTAGFGRGIYFNSLIIGDGVSVNANGSHSPTGYGQIGAEIINVIYSTGITVGGILNATGGNGNNGGLGISIISEKNMTVLQTGFVNTKGGDGTQNGNIGLYIDSPFTNYGIVNVTGGTGGTGTGGYGLYMNQRILNITNSGILNAVGGDGLDDLNTPGSGGHGIYFALPSQTFANDTGATLSAIGGNGGDCGASGTPGALGKGVYGSGTFSGFTPVDGTAGTQYLLPAITAGDIVRNSDSGATARFRSSISGDCWYTVRDAGTPAPSVNEVKADVSLGIIGTGENQLDLKGLTAGGKKIYVVVKSSEKFNQDSEVTALNIHEFKHQDKPAAPKYKVTFMGNKGKVEKKKKLTKTFTYGEKFGTLPKAKQIGYKFTGWYTKKKGGKKITAKSTMKFKKTTKLYAHWKKNGKIVKCKSAYMRAKAGKSQRVIGHVKKGQKVCIIKKTKRGNRIWYKIKAGKKTGWVYGKYVKFV